MSSIWRTPIVRVASSKLGAKRYQLSFCHEVVKIAIQDERNWQLQGTLTTLLRNIRCWYEVFRTLWIRSSSCFSSTNLFFFVFLPSFGLAVLSTFLPLLLIAELLELVFR